jgi:hypothetical protein
LTGQLLSCGFRELVALAPSSTMTLRMGIERRLREFIPEIAEVEQIM